MAKKSSPMVYNNIPKSWQWLIINYVVNSTKLLHFLKRKVERQLHQVLQVMHMYGNVNRGMDDKIPIQWIPIVFQ